MPVARRRNRAAEQQERVQAEHAQAVAALRKDGRAWIIRALLAVAFAFVVGLLLKAAIAVGTIAALVCIGLGLRQGIRAQLLERAGPEGE